MHGVRLLRAAATHHAEVVEIARQDPAPQLRMLRFSSLRAKLDVLPFCQLVPLL